MSKVEEAKPSSRVDALKEWTLNYYDAALNKGDMSIVDEIAEGTFTYCKNNIWPIEGAEGIKASMTRIRNAVPDVHFTIEEFFIEENTTVDDNLIADQVCIWWNWTGTFKGELRGIKPTGKFLTVHGASLLFVKDFKLIGARAVSDIYQAVGQLPPE